MFSWELESANCLSRGYSCLKIRTLLPHTTVHVPRLTYTLCQAGANI